MGVLKGLGFGGDRFGLWLVSCIYGSLRLDDLVGFVCCLFED